MVNRSDMLELYMSISIVHVVSQLLLKQIGYKIWRHQDHLYQRQHTPGRRPSSCSLCQSNGQNSKRNNERPEKPNPSR